MNKFREEFKNNNFGHKNAKYASFKDITKTSFKNLKVISSHFLIPVIDYNFRKIIASKNDPFIPFLGKPEFFLKKGLCCFLLSIEY